VSLGVPSISNPIDRKVNLDSDTRFYVIGYD
jgi:hypothetical protein